MIPYESMSPEAQKVFAAADLFGDGGKVSNANFAALILRSVAETIYHDWDGWECVGHLNALANELHTPSESD
jgi:hypothetical protein